MATLVKMPKWGLTMTAGTVTGWIVDEGSEVEAGAPLFTVETEKAVNDVEAPADGTLVKIVAESGSEVPVSGPVAVLAAPGESLSDDEIAALIAAAAPRAAGAKTSGGERPARDARAARRDDSGRVNASPAARKLAGELGIDLATLEATGPGGRITSEDVERAAASEAGVGDGESADAREELVALPNGGNLYALMAGPPAAAPIVFLHGLGGSRSTWETTLGGLVERHRVVALDLPGHGGSDKPDPATTDYGLTGLAEAVAGALAALRLDSALIAGHSLGGAVALHLALSRPELVRGLILVDSAGLGEEISGELLDRVEAEPSPDEARRLLRLFYEDERLILDRGVEEMYQSRRQPGATEALRAAAAASFSRDGQRIVFGERLGEVTVPTLLIWGERDRVIPVQHALAALMRLPDGWLKVLTGIGHVPQVEAVEAFTTAIDRFARAIATG